MFQWCNFFHPKFQPKFPEDHNLGFVSYSLLAFQFWLGKQYHHGLAGQCKFPWIIQYPYLNWLQYPGFSDDV